MIDIDITEALNNPGKKLEFEYNGIPEIEEISFAAPLKLKAELMRIDRENQIRVKGFYKTEVIRECVRCLDEIIETIDNEFDEIFSHDGKEEFYTFNDNKLSLDKMLYDDIMVTISPNLVCDNDCKGLCPQCGVNLNREKCDCKNTQIDRSNNPFSILQDLF